MIPAKSEAPLRAIGRYEILGELGRGAMGTVYRARDPVLDRLVALKTVAPGLLDQPDTLERFQREARSAARLQHPNIVTIYELGEVGGTHFIAMELLEGMDLAQAMVPPDRLGAAEKLRIVVDVCSGLDFAHKHGVFHRDVKPANVRLTRGGVKIVDFGIARLADSTATMTGVVMGTPSYIAPEVLSGARVDHRADMWAVGIILYELLAGRRPYEAPTIASLVYKIVHEPLPPLDLAIAGVGEGVGEVVARALSKEPGARFRDVAEMGDALQAAAGLARRGEPALSSEVRAHDAELTLREARRLLEGNDLDGALVAARRAQSLEPSRTDVIQILEQIEERLRERPPRSPEADTGPVLATMDMAAEGLESMDEPAALPTSGRPPSARISTAVLDELRRRGAAAFRELATFGEPPATQTACLSSDGVLLATSGADGAIRLWDLRSRTRTATLRTDMHKRTGHDALALDLAFSPDSSLLASAHVDGQVHLWFLARSEEVPVRLRHEALVGAVAFSPDGATLASGGLDSNLKLWDVRAALGGDARRRLHRQPSGVTAVCYTGAGRLVTGHANRLVRVLDGMSARLTATLRGPEGAVSLLVSDPERELLAVGSQDRTIRLYDLRGRAQPIVLAGGRKPTTSLAFFPGSAHVATVAQDNAVSLWDLDTRAPVAALWGESNDSFTTVVLWGEGDHLAVALADGRVRLWGPAG